MNTQQLSSYVAKVASSNQTEVIEAIQRTLSAQSGLLNGSLANLNSSAPLDELQGLLNIWSEEASDLNSLDISIVAETSKVDANISLAGEVIASASEIVRRISTDWNSYDLLRTLSNTTDTDKLEIPITIEQETRRSVGDITLVSYQTLNAILFGNKNDVSEVVAILEEKGSTPERLNAADIQIIAVCVDPQKIKLDLKSCTLILKGAKDDITFRENSIQMGILRAMFGKQGKNRVKLELLTLYEIWAKEQGWDIDKKSTTKRNWDWFDDKNVVGIEKEKFIKQVRNATNAINNKVRRFVEWTEDFLEVRNNTCRINPKLLKLKNSK